MENKKTTARRPQTEAEKAFVQAIIERRNGMNDRQIAEKLGISPALWCLVQKGKAGLSMRFVASGVGGFRGMKALAFRVIEERNDTAANFPILSDTEGVEEQTIA